MWPENVGIIHGIECLNAKIYKFLMFEGFFGIGGSPTLSAIAAVAQLDRVLGYEPRGRGFNSCQPHQIQTPEMKVSGVFVYL